MSHDPLFSLLVLLIVIVGFVMIIRGGNSGSALRFIFSPIFKLFGGLLRLVVLIGVAAVAFLALPGVFKEALDPHRPPSQHMPFAYPVGALEAQGGRYGNQWSVTQDFADTVNPVRTSLSGQHLGEDWVPSKGKAADTPVYAIARGDILINERNDSFGYVVMIRHETSDPSNPYVVSLYGHIIPDEALKETVNPGQKVGKIAAKDRNGCNKGCTFKAPGCKPRPGSGKTADECHGWPEHLHFELRGPDADGTIGFGYSPDQQGFLNPTNRGSAVANRGEGWIDRWR